jgi:hypothetical protein
VTNLRHHRVELLEVDRVLVAQMDGTRERPALRDLLRERADRGEVTLGDGAQGGNGDVAVALEASLRRLARAALLVA